MSELAALAARVHDIVGVLEGEPPLLDAWRREAIAIAREVEAGLRATAHDTRAGTGLREALIAVDVKLSPFGEPLCAFCGHPHTDAAWSDRDPDDGTCWSAGSLVCGCPKFITPAVRAIRSRAALAKSEQGS